MFTVAVKIFQRWHKSSLTRTSKIFWNGFA